MANIQALCKADEDTLTSTATASSNHAATAGSKTCRPSHLFFLGTFGKAEPLRWHSFGAIGDSRVPAFLPYLYSVEYVSGDS